MDNLHRLEEETKQNYLKIVLKALIERIWEACATLVADWPDWQGLISSTKQMRRREICFKLTINLHTTAQCNTQGGQVNTLHGGLHQPGAVHSVHCSSSFGDDLQGRQLIEHGGPGAQPESGVIITAVYLTHKNFDRSDGSFRQRVFSIMGQWLVALSSPS